MIDGPIIRPSGKGLLHSKVASKNILTVIESMFHNPWFTWGHLKDHERQSFFDAYRTKVAWRAKHEALVKRNFHMKASHRLSDILRDSRLRDEQPSWMGDAVWVALCCHWATVDFQKKNQPRQRKIGHQRKVGACTQEVPSVRQSILSVWLGTEEDQCRLTNSTATPIPGRVLARSM